MGRTGQQSSKDGEQQREQQENKTVVRSAGVVRTPEANLEAN
jgi:hypothetical protein